MVEGDDVAAGDEIGVVEGPGTSCPVRSPFDGTLMGMLAHPGERLRVRPAHRVVAGRVTGLPVSICRLGNCGSRAPRYRTPTSRARVDTNDAWIVERTGIRERRIAAPDETSSTLGERWRRPTRSSAPASPRPTSTCSCSRRRRPNSRCPTRARSSAMSLGLRCGSFDLSAACAGFVYELVVGASMRAIGLRPRPDRRRGDVEPHHRPRRPRRP